MAPTPPSYSPHYPHPSQSNLRLSRNRRPRNGNPYDPSHHATPPQQNPVTPRLDESRESGELEAEDNDIDIDEDEEEDEEEVEADDSEHDGDIEFGEDAQDGEDEEEGDIEEVPMEIDAPFDPAAQGLKEIGNLASWTVSSCKPGCGVEALRDDDTNLFWQSDGPQPHHLNIHFSRLVSIRSIRIFLNFAADESYTPTRITLLAGTGYHDLIPFSSLEFEKPSGWIDVNLDHVGGGKDGKTLRAFLVQVKIVENHQNGKDTHVRGLKIYARDERVRGSLGMLTDNEIRKIRDVDLKVESPSAERSWLVEPDWMGEPELR